ncbi:putative ABC transporter [Xylariaceae sp. AK1471]|nr:putative ABC transporter [Xylariaceae sp. AK1471]
MACPVGDDDTFGPQYCSHFDFTLLFEQSFLQIAPCALLLLVLPWRVSQLRRQHVKTLRTTGSLLSLKQVALVLLAAIQLVLLVTWTILPSGQKTRTSVPAAALSFLVSLALVYISSVEHVRSVRPSSIINAYILFSVVLDAAQARTLWIRPLPRVIPAVFTTAIAAKTLVCCLEARSKEGMLLPPYRNLAPEDLVGLYSRTVLWWINPMLWQGYKGVLSFKSLYAIDSSLASRHLEQTFSEHWQKRSKTSRRPLLWTTARSVRLTFLAMVIPRLFLSALRLSQPLLIHRITDYLGHLDEERVETGQGLIGATVLIYLGLAVTNALYKRNLHRLITMVRGVLLTAVQTHTLALPADRISDKAALTLISTDVNRIGTSLLHLDNMFAAPIEVIVAIWLLVNQAGISSVGPVALAFAIGSISFFEIRKAIPEQKKWLAAVQERVGFIAAVLGPMKGFKMLGLGGFLIERIQNLRIKELAAYAHFRKFIALRNALAVIPNAFGPPIAITTLVLLNGEASLQPTVAFTTLALVQLLTTPIQEIITTIPMFLNALVSLQRIEIFLLMEKLGEESSEYSESSKHGPESLTDQSSDVLQLKPIHGPQAAAHIAENMFVSLQAIDVDLGAQRKKVLRGVDFSVAPGDLALVVGPVGCGKSTLLKVIIGDVKDFNGARQISTDHFGYCAQDTWLPNDTIRNIIANDSKIDELWYSRVTEACALPLDFDAFPSGDNTLVGSQGSTVSGGQKQRISLARALYARKSLIVADDILSGLDVRTSQHVFDHVFGAKGLCKAEGLTAILVTHATKFLPLADNITVLCEGKVVENGTFSELNSKDGYVYNLHLGEEHEQNEAPPPPPVASVRPNNNNVALDDLEASMACRTTDWAVYKYYSKSIGWVAGLSILFSAVGFAFGMKFAELWVRLWSGASLEQRGVGVWVGIYFFLAAVAVISVFALVWVILVRTVPKSSAQLHRQLLCAVMRAPYSFFVETDAGTTLNRLSTDMHMIESDLAFAVLQTIEGGALVIGSGILIAAGSSYLGVTIPFVLGILYAIQKFYLRTSRQMRIMDLEAQAPLLTHFQETISGITTIRAFGWQHQSHETFLDRLDDSQRPYYLLLCIQRWLNLVLDLTTAAIAITAVTLAMTVFDGTSSPASIGLSLLNILGFNTQLAYLITAWTQLETSLGAVARCKSFEMGTASEDKPSEIEQPPPDWPSAGQLVFEDVTASYRDGGEDVLKRINFSVAAGEKIGICGRSGSGKSSLILTLVHMLDRKGGRVVLDDVDLAKIPRQTIRSRLTVISQEPALFPGSVRENLDPLAERSTTAIEESLRKVGLLHFIRPHGGLDARISDLALSQGQMQLLAVARAILHKSKVLILDEMTSSVDSATEDMILQLVRDNFPESTVIAVAHRLNTVMDFDKVIVMAGGELVEMGAPLLLLEKEDGHFRALCGSNSH